MMTRFVLPFSFALLLTACGSSGGTASAGSGGGSSGGSIPAPGSSNDVDNDFKSAEPNDSPSQATPLGQAKGPDVYVWVSSNTIGGGDDSDYFVFESGSKAGNFTLGMSGLCWSGAIATLTATLWKVDNGAQVMPPIHTWKGVDKCVMSAPGDAPVEANTEYLLGVTATGGSGTYAA
jgi:hypothetical protein